MIIDNIMKPPRRSYIFSGGNGMFCFDLSNTLLIPYENNPTKHILNAKYKYTFKTKLLQVGINLDENAILFIANSNTINTNKIT
jgi:hypothetical protein